MGTIDSAWFHKKLADKGVSLRDMARFMKLDASAVSRMLNGGRKMSAEEQDQVAAYLDVPLDEVAARRRGEVHGFHERGQEPFSSNAGVGASGTGRPQTRRPAVIDKTGRHPIFGCMKGTMTIPDGLDLTAPADPDWGKVYEDD
ncbi:helix-turn-helix domain-containing protein [Rhizobium puerariae]|uniref:Helix-turn-helix domain-containing protein n=1 Tax=Rhizobium puerariae TaxID=1585791 RepID=A0ABV6AMB3_9HYPH